MNLLIPPVNIVGRNYKLHSTAIIDKTKCHCFTNPTKDDEIKVCFRQLCTVHDPPNVMMKSHLSFRTLLIQSPSGDKILALL